MQKWVLIETYQNRMEAELGKGLLESNGIKAIVFSDDAGGSLPSMSLTTGGARLFVEKKDTQKAIKILKNK